MRDLDLTTKLDLALLVGRLSFAPLFLISGYYKIMNWPAIVTTLTNQGAPVPLLGGNLAIAAEMIFPIMLILGVQTRWACFGLIAYTVGTMFIGHRFWDFSGGAYVTQLIAFFKNLALCGGLLALAYAGPGRHALQPGR